MTTSEGTKKQAAKRRRSAVRDRVVELRRVKASELRADPRNWRRHPERQRAALRALLAEVGFADALLAREDADGALILVDGHLRGSLDPDQVVPVLVLDVTEDEAATLLLTLDPLASLATADSSALAELLRSVETESAAVRELLDMVARGAGLPVMPGLFDPDDIPDVPETPRTKPGEVWALGEHRIACLDSRDPKALAMLAAGGRADLLWTDPPYGVTYRGKTRRGLTISGDHPDGLDALLQEAFAAADGVLRPGAPIYVAHPAGPLAEVFLTRFTAQGWRLRQTLVWCKDAPVLGHGDYHYQHEPIL